MTVHTPIAGIMRDKLSDHDKSIFLLGDISEVTIAHAEGEFALQNTTPLSLKNMDRVKLIS